MKLSQITISNIKSFFEGYSKLLLDKFIGSPEHIKEQIVYRHKKCEKDCIPQEGCIHCGCDPIGKHFVTKSCNEGERFPDLMGKEDWEQFKLDNDVTKV